MTPYKLKFLPVALKEWKKLDKTVQQQFKKKLQERLTNPRVASAQLSGFTDVYKIKLRALGYRLAYVVQDEEITIIVVTAGKREHSAIYDKLRERLQ